MLPLSCVNCCYNALQHDTIGTSYGYCTEFRSVLRKPEALTCGRQLRKDLLLDSVNTQSDIHKEKFSSSDVVFLRPNGHTPRQQQYVSRDATALAANPVAATVAEWGQLPTKFASLVALRQLPGPRAELARLSLGRSYVKRCTSRGGDWTSGIHLYAWTRKALLDEPEITADDIRTELAITLERQISIAKWSLLMFRLVFLSDLGFHATTGNVRQLRHLPVLAAEATGSLSYSTLHKWIQRQGAKLADRALSPSSVEKIKDKVRVTEDEEAHVNGHSRTVG
jgi:hypothetical protein